MWNSCDHTVMEQLQSKLAALSEQFNKQSADTSSALKAVRDSLQAMAATNGTVSENIQGLNKWAPAIDNSI
jgi:two-component sensor histidine kinase